MDTLLPAPPARDHTAIPIYKLYGYGNVWTPSDPLFCETIAAQSKLHNWHVAAHKHLDLMQVLLLESGRMTAWLDGRTTTLDSTHVVVVPQGVAHEFVFRPDTVGHVLTLTLGLLQEMSERFGLVLAAVREPLTLPLSSDDEDRHLKLTFHRLTREYRSPYSPQRGPLLQALLASVLVWIERRIHPHEYHAAALDPGSRHLARYARLIEEHHSQRHQVAWYAGRLGLTPAHLNTIAQALAGKSALQLIHERLMLQARRELIYTPRRIAMIGDALGFSDPGYFTRFFKRLAGLSPKDFRRQAIAGHGVNDAAPAAEARSARARKAQTTGS